MMNLTIGYLYGDLMNIYGDTGNIIALKKRAQWRGIKVQIKNISIAQDITPRGCDIYFFGGGQDQAQEEVAKNLTRSDKGRVIKSEVERGVPLLSICGGYQLLGEYYQPFAGPRLKGVGVFPAFTVASEQRMIGNIVVSPTSDIKALTSELVGFENHSGKTHLKGGSVPGSVPLGKVVKGFGNNGEDRLEGCVYKNAIGCYMHGSLLPKNPQLTDWLLNRALEIKYGKKIRLKKLKDEIEKKAHQKAVLKFS